MKITIVLDTEESEQVVIEYFKNLSLFWLTEERRIKEIKVEGETNLIFNGKKIEQC